MTEYLTELTQDPAKEYFRPNFFTNTPDILPVFLQEGGRPAFRIRLVLAATLSPVYGIYNGFELCENTPIPGREEYLHSEKYEYKVWDWDRPGNIKEDIAVLNRFRRNNPAMQEFINLRFLDCADPNILAYAKISADRANIVIVVVNLDPHGAHEDTVELPLGEFGLTADAEILARGGVHRPRRQLPRRSPALSPRPRDQPRAGFPPSEVVIGMMRFRRPDLSPSSDSLSSDRQPSHDTARFDRSAGRQRRARAHA